MGIAARQWAQTQFDWGRLSEQVGAIVMEELKRLDKVAYVRFASVYRSFRDVGEFMSELKDLLNAKE